MLSVTIRLLQCCLIACWCFLTSMAFATSDVNKEEEYQCVFGISEGQAAVREFILKDEVYSCIQRSDLNDISVINSLGQVVPFTIKKPVQGVEHKTITLPFYQEPQQAKFRDKTQVNRILKQANVDVSHLKIDLNNQHFYRSMIVELATIKGQLIDFELDIKKQNGLKAAVVLEVSDTLDTWRMIHNDQHIYQLSNKQTTLSKTRFAIPQYRDEKYMRVSFISSTKEFLKNIQQVSANVIEKHDTKTYQWQPVTDHLFNQKTKRWQYSWENKYPVELLRFTANSDIRYYRGSIYTVFNTGSRSETDKSEKLKNKLKSPFKKSAETNNEENSQFWRYKGTFDLSWLTDTKDTDQRIVAVSMDNAQKIELLFKDPQNIVESQLPNVEIGWQQLIVTFLAQGEGPYSLQIGVTADTTNHQATNKAWLKETAQSVTLLEKQEITPVAEEIEPPQQPDNKRPTYLLWLTIAIAFIVLIIMLIRLTKGMSKSD